MKRPRIVCCLIGTFLLFLTLRHLSAANFNILNGDVIGLRNAITTSNGNGEDDTIDLAAGGTYTLFGGTSSIPQIGSDSGHKLTIHGNGATLARDAGAPNFRIFYIQNSANVTVSKLTVANGHLTAHGGAFYVDGEEANTTLTLDGCILTGNFGDYGGAIYNDGFDGGATLIITNCTFSSNSSINNGGVIFNDGSGVGIATLNVSNSTFTQNSNTHNGGGAIQHDGFMGTVTGTMTNCTFSQNSSAGDGAAIYVDGDSGNAMLTVKNCTFNSNTATGNGDDLYNSGGGAVVQLVNNVFKGSTTGANRNVANGGGTLTSLGHNLSDDAGSGVLIGPGDQVNINPMLDPAGLQNNGGPTQTIALLAGSQAIDMGDSANAPTRDQRYYQRSGAVDIGAFEFGGTLAPISADVSKTHGAAGVFTVNFPLTGQVGVECRTGGAGGNHQLVMLFATPVTVGGASVTSGTGSVSNFTVGGSLVTVNLTGITNAQQINVRLTNVNDGTHTNNVDVPMRFLFGDTSGNSSVNASDVTQTKSRAGQALTNSNFRSDVNVSGTVTATDITIVKIQIGTSIP
jgi:predicted outer membrane repeat protein